MSSSDQNPPPRRAGTKVFISYRRPDAPYALLLKQGLAGAFGEEAVFRDVDDLTPGEVFPQRLREAVESCDTFLALISPSWLGDAARLQDPDDFVRIEIATALARKVKVIPLLLNNTQMPPRQGLPADIDGLTLRHALELRDNRLGDDIRRLIEAIRPPRPLRNKLYAAARFLFATWPGRAAVAALLLTIVLAATFQRPFVFKRGDPTHPWVRYVRFDEMGDCRAELSCFWVDTAAAGGVRTGTLYGVGLAGGQVYIDDSDGLGITELKTLDAGSNDEARRFSFKLNRPLFPSTRLVIGVLKSQRREDGSVEWRRVGEREEVEVAFAQPTPIPDGALPLGCFRQFLPPGRWAVLDYGDPEYRVVLRHDQPLGEVAGVLLVEYGRLIGAVRFRFAWKGWDEVGNDTGLFTVERVVGSDCRPVQDYENIPPGEKKGLLKSYDHLSMRLEQRRYDLRLAYRPDKTVAARFADRGN